MLALVASELAEDRLRISARLPYPRSVADPMSALSERALRGEPFSYRELRRAAPNGFAPVLLSTTAWELARTADVLRHLDLEVMQAVSTAYEHQSFYLGKWDHLEVKSCGMAVSLPHDKLTK